MASSYEQSTEAGRGTSTEIKEIAAKAIRDGMGTCANMLTIEIMRATYTPPVMTYFSRGIIGYIAAAGALAFSGRDITTERIISLLQTVGIEPTDDYLAAISKLDYKNELVYVNAIYFAKANGKEPNIEMVTEIVRSMGVAPDHRIAGYVIEFSREYMSGAYNFVGAKLDQGGPDEKVFKRLYLGMLDLSDDMAELSIRELNLTIEASSQRVALRPESLPYLTAIGSLAFAGQEINKENMTGIIEALGIKTDLGLLEAFTPVPFKNPILYIISIYYLYGLDMKIDVKSICKLVEVLGGEADTYMAEGVFAYYQSKAKTHI